MLCSIMEFVRNPDEIVNVDNDKQCAPPAGALRVGLSKVERKTVEALISGSTGATGDFVAQRATAFSVDDDGQVRRRSLSKAAAVQEALMAQLSALLAAAVGRGDADAVKLLDRALSGSTKRFTLLIDELRAEVSGGRRAVVQVGVVANNVNISRQG